MKFQIGDGTNWLDLTPSGGTVMLIDPGVEHSKGDREVSERSKFIALSAYDVTNTISELQRWFKLAQERGVRIVSPRVYLRSYSDFDTDWWRSELFEGIVNVDPKRERYAVGRGVFDAMWTREARWRKETATSYAAAVTLNNTYVGGSYTNIAALGSVSSAIYAPLSLKFLNGSAASIDKLYVGLYRSQSSVTTANLGAATTLEAESGTVLTGTGTVTALGTSSGGNYRAFSWSGTSNTSLMYWSLTTANLAILGGRSWKPFVRISTALGNVQRISIAVKYGSAVLHQTEYVMVSGTSLLELPSIYIPMHTAAVSGYAGLTLELIVQGTGTNTIGVDALHLLPTDGYRAYVTTGSYIATNEAVMDKPYLDGVVVNSASGDRGTIRADGSTLEAGCNEYTYLMALSVDSTGASLVNAVLTTTVDLQPQRYIAL